MTAPAQIARCTASVKKTVLTSCRRQLATLFEDRECSSNGRALEQAVWTVLVEVGRQLLEALLTLECWHVAKPEFDAAPGARLRLDEDYTLSQMTTLGTVRVPLFAFRGPETERPTPPPGPPCSLTTRTAAPRSCASSGKRAWEASSRSARLRTR